MNTASATLNKKINNYLGQLNTQQKKALLTVAKTFVKEQTEDAYSEELKVELDNRYEEYKNGGTLISEAEVNKRIRKIIKSKRIIAHQNNQLQSTVQTNPTAPALYPPYAAQSAR